MYVIVYIVLILLIVLIVHPETMAACYACSPQVTALS